MLSILIILGIYSLLQLLLLLGQFTHQYQLTNASPQPFIKVSILVAARNEEQNILRCLQALEKLNYPKSHLQILIGNDQSTDATEQIVRQFIQDKPHFQLINIQENLGKALGKANVLAHLAKAAQGDFWLITDADIAVLPNWVQAMLQSRLQVGQTNKADESVGIITGFTLVQGTSLFAKMQAIDWVYALGLIKVWSDQDIAVTTMGNNMGISPEAYRKTGGYEAIPFSVTEDFALFQAIVQQGYAFRNVIHPEIMATTQPIKTVKGWLQQRKRWMSGALQAPWFLTLFFGLHSSFWVLVAGLFWLAPAWAIGASIFKITIQSIFIGRILHRIGQLKLLKFLPFFEVYHTLFTWAMMVYYLLPVKVVWKGRRY